MAELFTQQDENDETEIAAILKRLADEREGREAEYYHALHQRALQRYEKIRAHRIASSSGGRAEQV